MGSLNNNAGALAAFTGQIYPNGLDLGRCVIHQDLGVFVANPAATFLAGQLVTKTAAGIEAANGQGVIGVAKWNKANTLYGVVADEPVKLVGTTASNLKHANVSNVKVSAAAGSTAAALTVTTDYTVNATNGTVTRVAGQAIGDGDTVYVTYTWALQNSDYDFQGRNFFNFQDDVTIQDGHITVIVDWAILFTTQYDTSKVYDVVGTASNLYCGSSGKPAAGYFTNDNSAGDFVGRVIQAPTASDPYLGVMFAGGPTDAS